MTALSDRAVQLKSRVETVRVVLRDRPAGMRGGGDSQCVRIV